MSLLLLLLPLLAQADATAPLVGNGPAGPDNLPVIDRPEGPNRRRAMEYAPPPLPTPTAESRLANCLAKAGGDAEDALDTATAWLQQAQGPARADPQLCLGTAYAALQRWSEAETAFVAGRDFADPGDHALRARLGTMAGNAALADGSPVEALTVLDTAKREATAAADNSQLAGITVDRARALVLLKRDDDAAAALAEARAADPSDATSWLLSATLSRRMNHLPEAQQQIEAAARLAPTDPAIGLEAGVIAVLAGHEEAARHSWQSVVAADPEGPDGQQARLYLSELGGGPGAGPASPLPARHAEDSAPGSR